MFPAVFLRDYVHILHQKKKKRRALRRVTRLTHWHEEEAQSRMFTSCTRVQRRFSYLLSLSSSDSKPLPLGSPNKDSSPEPILSESRPRSNTFHCGSHAKRTRRKTLGKIDKKLWVTSLRAVITQNFRWQPMAFLVWLDAAFDCATAERDHNAIRPRTDEKMTSETHPHWDADPCM